jgi:hypothetical protein
MSAVSDRLWNVKAGKMRLCRQVVAAMVLLWWAGLMMGVWVLQYVSEGSANP